MARGIRITAFAFLMLTLLLTGCRTKKETGRERGENVSIKSIATLPAITPDTTALQHLSGNTALNIAVNGKGSVNIKGKLRVKRGEGIQISVTPLGLIEAACIEFLPQKIRFINKLQKTYTEMPYSEASIIGLSGINYNVLEAIFLNYTFLPDGRLACKGLKEMSIKDVGESYHLETKNKKAMQYRFLINKESGHLLSCNGLSSTGESIECLYSGFEEIGNIPFPNNICITFKGDATIKLNIGLSKADNNPFKFSSRNVNNSYLKQNIDDFIKSIKQNL